jgi:hypothetical protein
LQLTREAIADSVNAGIAHLQGDALNFHQHPDRDWTPDTQTELAGDSVVSVRFLGHQIIV